MIRRNRRLRSSNLVRNLVRETKITMDEIVYPLFVVEGEKIKEEISTMPGVYRFSVDELIKEIEDLKKYDIKNIMLFGVVSHKDEKASEAFSENGIVQKAVREIKKNNSHIFVITDVCMCGYTCHGHCGILDEKGIVDNDKTIKVIADIALSHVKAGADMVAPSDMMDGRINEIRERLDENGYVNTPIMSYSAKYASSFYGPFRDAADSAPAFGDRKTYQMDPANSKEAMIECENDIYEGADIIMVKPALSYLDVIKEASLRYDVPIAAYNVSGEYSMLKLAIKNNILSEDAIFEAILSIKRAGANIIITYFAKDIWKYINK